MARHQFLHLRLFLLSPPKPLLLNPLPSLTSSCNPTSSNPISRNRISTLTTRRGSHSTVASLAKEILSSSANDLSPDLASLLESDKARSILRLSTNGSPFLRLLSLLKRRPLLALQVFDWRRNLRDSPPLIAEEYASAIALAGRAQNLSLAVKLFNESKSTAKGPILYNALMTAFMYNGEVKRAISLFHKLKKEKKYGPDTVSYNILLSLYGYHVLVDQMESVLRDMDSSGIPRSVVTYKMLMYGYLRSRRWKQMERIFDSLKEPDTSTRLLMLRGYTIAGKLKKMERMYELVKGEVHAQERSLICAMICAYSKVGGDSSVRKIEELVKLVREEEYFPYLHIVLIKVYAKEGLLDEMERLIFDANKRNIVISSQHVMRTILALYFKSGDVERLDSFIKQAERAGWSLCKDLYRCKMILYSRLGRLTDMSCEVDKMDSYWPVRDRYTLKILYKGFSNSGRMWEMNMVIGLMFKYGFQFPQGAVVY
ncbi:Pentatricopeptide repeat-containing protein [Rhynchospora pubera]|uniref:Pentatricopeptide repeat-containing protein n=1 Tax=Rhynchospora pubera TaxID=906938 RepID=A0AAV8GIH2_9POAL|nr:Pentatricopeptide repeat-containing protein [Rhynchospora pubera]